MSQPLHFANEQLISDFSCSRQRVLSRCLWNPSILPDSIPFSRGNPKFLRVSESMPPLQTALPTELADNVIRLYRECLRRAKFIGHKQHNTELVVAMVRKQFKKNMHEKDPEKIQQFKDDAARGLINHILFESEKLTGRKISRSS